VRQYLVESVDKSAFLVPQLRVVIEISKEPGILVAELLMEFDTSGLLSLELGRPCFRIGIYRGISSVNFFEIMNQGVSAYPCQVKVTIEQWGDTQGCYAERK